MEFITRRTWVSAAGAAGVLTAAPAIKDGALARRSMREARTALRGVHDFLTTPFRPDLSLDMDGPRRDAAHHASRAPGMTAVVGGGLGEWFTMVAGAGGGYRLPMRVAENGEKYWPTVLEWLTEIPNVIGFTDPSGGTSIGRALGSLIEERLPWIAEGETRAPEAPPAGSRAGDSAVPTFVPNACGEIRKHGIAGERAQPWSMKETAIDPVARVRSPRPGYGISGIKAFEALGRAGDPVRPPGTDVAREDRVAIAGIARKHAEA